MASSRSFRRGSRVISLLTVLSLLAVMVPFSSLAVAGPAQVAADRAPDQSYETHIRPSTTRVGGENRLETAVAVSREAWDESEWVVIARADEFADALVGGPLAETLAAPILTTPSNALAPEAAAEIDRLGATKAIVLGGVTALSGQVVADLYAAGITEVQRIGGVDRYDTAAMVARRVDAAVGGTDRVVLTRGDAFPDALSVSGYAAWAGMPIILTRPTALPAVSRQVLTDLDPIGGLVIGGEAAITPEVASVLGASLRLGGESRYETAKLVAEYTFSAGFSYASVMVATGEVFADALVAGPLGAKRQAPLVLSESTTLTPAAADFFNSHCSSIEEVLVLGGPAAIAPGVVTAILEAATTELAEDIEIVSPELAAKLETVAPDGSSIVFEAGAPGLENIEPEDILVSAPTAGAPSGYLLKVISVPGGGSGIRPAAVSGSVSIETTMASLDEVIIKGSVDITGSVDPTLEAAPESALLIDSADAVDDGTVDVGFDQVNIGQADQTAGSYVEPGIGTNPWRREFDMDFTKTGENPAKMPGDVAASLEGEISFAGDFVLNASWGYLYWHKEWWGGWPVYGLRELTIAAYLDEHIELDLDVYAEISVEKDVIPMISEAIGTSLATKIGGIGFWIGPVPVWIDLILRPMLDVGVNVSVVMNMDMAQHATVSVGIYYNHWTGWWPWSHTNFNVDMREFDLMPVGAGVRLGAGVAMDALFYGVVGPYFGARARVEYANNITWTPWWRWKWGIDGFVGGRVHALGRDLLNRRWFIPMVDVTVAAAGGAFPDPNTVWWPARGEMPAYEPATDGLDAVADPFYASARPVPAMAHAIDGGIDPDSVDPTDFVIDGLDVTAATVQPDGSTVRLAVAGMVPGESYVVECEDDAVRSLDDAWSLSSTAGFVGFSQPSVSEASAPDLTTVEVTFDSVGELDPATVDPSDFTIPGVGVTASEVLTDGVTVKLTTDRQGQRAPYDVSVADGALADEYGFPVVASSAPFLSDWDIVRVDGGANHYLALDSDGELWAWGVNTSGQCGSAAAPTIDPTPVGEPGPWVEIEAANAFSMAIKADGTLWTWGSNVYGQLGHGTTGGFSATPTQLGDATDWVDVDGWTYQALGVREVSAGTGAGTVWSWGGDTGEVLGNGTGGGRDEPGQVGTDTDWTTVAAGKGHSLVVKSNGDLWGWGWNEFGQVGDGSYTIRRSPVFVDSSHDWVELSAGNWHTIAKDANGDIYGWGHNGSGQYGNGNTTFRSTPFLLPHDFTHFSAGHTMGIGLKPDGTIWVWGNMQGGSGTPALSPVQRDAATDWAFATSGWTDMMVMNDESSPWHVEYDDPATPLYEVWPD